ncbi:MAG: CRISPR-associated endonuclease Cas2 [Candidatus Portnoybacteria bacterium]|jgi:hypothetical protein|nr:CRISPR-associated endonuclease Cas2 [Candidatus Portnoybacteria bacterium]
MKLRTLLKLPCTEKFLWDLYEFLSKTGEITSRAVSQYYNRPFSDFNIFRDEWTDKNKKKYQKQQSRKKFTELIYRFKKHGYLKTLKVKDNIAITITSKGLEKILKIKLKSLDKRKRKDGKWQMILFDIPENQRRNRDLFRGQLKYLGYQNFQKSIWVCPYDTLQETKALIKRYRLENWVELLLVNKIGLG